MSTHDGILTGVNQREALAKIIELHMLGVSPDDQDVVLEDHDWRLVLSALRAQQAEAQDEGVAGERERIAREIDPVAFLDVQSRASGRNGERNAHAARMKALKKADEIIASRAHPSPTPAADADRVRIAVEALKPFARLELPKKPVGNAGAYSLLHTDIRRAAEAVAVLKSTDDGRAAP